MPGAGSQEVAQIFPIFGQTQSPMGSQEKNNFMCICGLRMTGVNQVLVIKEAGMMQTTILDITPLE